MKKYITLLIVFLSCCLFTSSAIAFDEDSDIIKMVCGSLRDKTHFIMYERQHGKSKYELIDTYKKYNDDSSMVYYQELIDYVYDFPMHKPYNSKIFLKHFDEYTYSLCSLKIKNHIIRQMVHSIYDEEMTKNK